MSSVLNIRPVPQIGQKGRFHPDTIHDLGADHLNVLSIMVDDVALALTIFLEGDGKRLHPSDYSVVKQMETELRFLSGRATARFDLEMREGDKGRKLDIRELVLGISDTSKEISTGRLVTTSTGVSYNQSLQDVSIASILALRPLVEDTILKLTEASVYEPAPRTGILGGFIGLFDYTR
jgi:hypothetical protein